MEEKEPGVGLSLASAETIARRGLFRFVASPDGLIAITIRPVEYWDVDPNAVRLGLSNQQKETHNQTGFSFLPHDRPAVDGDITYGDTSIRLDWLRNVFPKLKIVGIDRSLSDPTQLYVFLQKS